MIPFHATTPPLPSFLIIGAQKSATRWLRLNLGLHPDVYTAGRELSFFNRGNRFRRRGLDWYRAQFDGWCGEPVVGEATPGYLIWRHDPEAVAARIQATIPDVRLIAILRNPIDRAYSAMVHQIRRKRLPRETNLLEVVRRSAPEDEWFGFVAGGWYAASLRGYIDRFGPQLLVLLHDDLRADARAVYARSLDHIGASDGFLPSGLERVRFSNQTPVASNGSDEDTSGSNDSGGDEPDRHDWDTKGFFARRRARAASRRTDNGDAMLTRPLTFDERVELFEYFREDVQQLESMLGRDLAIWAPTESAADDSVRVPGEQARPSSAT